MFLISQVLHTFHSKTEGKVLKFMFLLGKRFIRKIHQRHGEYYFVVNRSRVATSIAKPGKMAEHFPVREF